ncbi:MAG: hypothetical protein NZM00_13970 [Anaerolinea sp.]|nr:hypothetical protein [Anaerolinea sp.]
MRVSRSRSLVVHRVSRARRAALVALISAIVVTVMALLITPQHPQIVLAGAGALLTQTLIGLFYWTVVLRRMLAPMPRSLRRSAILLLYGLGTLALLPYPLLVMVTVINPPRGPLPASTIALGGTLFLAACTIYIHLFLVKLVRSADDQRARLMRRQVNARLMRELVRSERHSRECIA